jgi:hypothetical protein
MSTAVWMKKSVSSAVHPATALVATARLKSTNMAAETINAFIAGHAAPAHVAIALMESTKSNRAEFTLGCLPSWMRAVHPKKYGSRSGAPSVLDLLRMVGETSGTPDATNIQ